MMNFWKIRNIANMIFIIALVFTFIIKLRFPIEVSIATNKYLAITLDFSFRVKWVSFN